MNKKSFRTNIILQGDLLYTKSDLKSAKIDGQEMIIFTQTQSHTQCQKTQQWVKIF